MDKFYKKIKIIILILFILLIVLFFIKKCYDSEEPIYIENFKKNMKKNVKKVKKIRIVRKVKKVSKKTINHNNNYPTNASTLSTTSSPLGFGVKSATSNILFKNLLTMTNDEISRAAFTNGQLSMVNNTAVKPTVNVYLGPNTKPFLKDSNNLFTNSNDFKNNIEKLVHKFCNMYSNFSLPPTYNFIIYNFDDEQWATDNYLTNIIYGGNKLPNINGCTSKETCGGANASIFVNPESKKVESYCIISLSDNSYKDPYFYLGGIIIHETMHTINEWQFYIKNKNIPFLSFQRQELSNKATNGWYNEAQPHMFATLVVSETYENYIKQRNLNVRGHPFIADGKQTIFDYSIVSITNVLNIEKSDPRNNPYYSVGYSMGVLAIEPLIAIGGVDSAIQLFVNEANGHSFSQSFQMIYGIPWSEAAPILAQIVQRQWCSIPDPLASVGINGIPPICANITTPFAS